MLGGPSRHSAERLSEKSFGAHSKPTGFGGKCAPKVDDDASDMLAGSKFHDSLGGKSARPEDSAAFLARFRRHRRGVLNLAQSQKSSEIPQPRFKQMTAWRRP
eukprot:scaffold2649_cov137-Cylindrotheca_fusiformis.AAC.11